MTWPALWRLMTRQPLGVAGAVIVVLLIVVALFAPQLAPHGPKETTFGQYVSPGREFPMGTDNLGRDVLSRVIWGARLSL
jgi:peptide/nickel transport system permease protein